MKRILIALIRFYRKNISPRTAPCCRFTPTCSQYALTAIERFGAIRGTAMAIWRILRCGPWCAGGYDPVPEKRQKKKCCGKKHEDEKEQYINDAESTSSSTIGENDCYDDSNVNME